MVNLKRQLQQKEQALIEKEKKVPNKVQTVLKIANKQDLLVVNKCIFSVEGLEGVMSMGTGILLIFTGKIGLE